MAGNYRDAEAIKRDEQQTVRNAAIAFCDKLGIKDEEGTYREQAEVLAVAMIMFSERNQEVHDAWKGFGYLGNLITMHGKSIRLMNNLWWKAKAGAGRNEKPIDNAVDLINYAAFFIRCFVAGDERGEPGT